MMKALLVIVHFLCCLLLVPYSFAQNMAGNPSFEITNACPNGTAPGIQPANCPPWVSVPGGTPDYFNPCSVSNQTDAPANAFGYQQAHTGNSYAGMLSTGVSKEYIQAPLATPMIAGRKYYASMYVNLANNSQVASDRIGFYFSNNSLQQISGNPNNQPWVPHIVNPQFNYLTDTANWMKIEGIYTAGGGEQWVAIGNFTGISSNTIPANGSGSVSRAYYYIDDVCILDMNGPPVATSRRDTFICAYPASIAPVNSGEKYLWSTGDTTSGLVINTPGNYWVKVIRDCGYTMDSIIVKLKVPQISTATTDTFLCAGQTIELSTPAQAGSILWSTGSGNGSISVATAGNYWVSYDLPGCKKHTDSIRVHPAEDQLLYIADTIICNQRPYQLWLPEGYRISLWSDGSTEPYLLVNESGVYHVQATTVHHCPVLDTFQVTLTDTRQQFSDTVVCAGEPFSLILNTSVSATAGVLWQDATTLPYLHITSPGIYTAQITDGSCVSTNSMTVSAAYCDCPFLVPNAFSPNSDGLNDAFGVSFPGDCMVTGYQMHIFDRWGQSVFTSNNIDMKWNGNVSGRPAAAGTYFYMVKFEAGTRRRSYTRKGDITLIR